MHERPDLRPPVERATLENTMNKKVDRAAKKFYASLKEARPNPGILSMAIFLYTKPFYKKHEKTSVDYLYWKSHGWLENDACYYYDPKAGMLRKSLSRLASRLMGIVAK